MTGEEAIKTLYVFTRVCDDAQVIEAVGVAIKALEARPKGKWEYTDGRWGLGNWRCSKCGGYTNKDTHYCPNCGADMRGEE